MVNHLSSFFDVLLIKIFVKKKDASSKMGDYQFIKY